MTRLLRAEWIKLRTVTMNWVLGIIAGAFPLAVTLLTAYFNGDSSEFGTSDLASVLGGTTVVCALLCGVIAAASITSEYFESVFSSNSSSGGYVMPSARLSTATGEPFVYRLTQG